MSKSEFKPGDKVRFRADAGEAERSFLDANEGRVRAIPVGDPMEVIAPSDVGLPESCLPPGVVLVAWYWTRVFVHGSRLELYDDIKKCTCDIRVLTSTGCRCGGA